MKDLSERAGRLLAQIAKVEPQLRDLEPGGVAGRLFAPKARLEEYERKQARLNELRNSLENIRQHGVEVMQTGSPVGVDMDVPISGKAS